MKTKRQLEILFNAEYGVGVLIHILYTLWRFPEKDIKVAIVISALFYLPAIILAIFSDYVQYWITDAVWVVSINLYVVCFATYVHSYSLLPLAFLTIAVFFAPIMRQRLNKYHFLLSVLLSFITSMIVAFDRSYLLGSNFQVFIAGNAVTLFCIGVLSIMVTAAENGHKELERKSQEAMEANQSKSTFLANMSHEIRTPMNAILGMSEILMMDEELDSQREYIVTIHNSAKALLGIINDILDFSKIDAGKMELILENYDLESMVQDVENIIETRLKDKPVSFVVEIDPELPSTLYGDMGRLKQILINILGNAVKHTNKGLISLKISGEKLEDGMEKLTFLIEDTGNGIPEKDMEHLFEAFTQADTKRNRNVEGTGLGLAITKRLVEAMDGNVQLDSEYGKGTKVTTCIMQQVVDDSPWVTIEEPEKYQVYICEPNRYYRESMQILFSKLHVKSLVVRDVNKLKITVEDSKNAFVFYNYSQCYEDICLQRGNLPNTHFIGMFDMFEQIPQEMRLERTAMRPIGISKLSAILEERDRKYDMEESRELFVAPEANVLVVDDNAVNLKVAESMLKLYEVKVSFASSGMECIRLLEQGKQYDIIFMDHMMPKMDGVETTQIIRETEKASGERRVIVALTANAFKGVKKMFLESGMDDYISKPIDISNLEHILKKWLKSDKIHAKKETIREEKGSNKLEQKDGENTMMNHKWKHYDTAVGLEQVGGDEEIYYEILQMVIDEAEETKHKIIEFYSQKDYVNYEIVVHALKSSMANVGEMDLSALAKKHEFAVKEDRLSDVDDHLVELLELYDEVVAETKEILNANGISLE